MENDSTLGVRERPVKPLGQKAYGSIPHLPGSRIGPGDHHCHSGQEAICTTRPRRGDRIIVTEKLDGACMSIARIGDDIVPLTRAGYHADDGSYPHLRMFAPYVRAREHVFRRLLASGERVVGEWLVLAHGTIYDARHPRFAPFIAFDIFRDNKRVLSDEFIARCSESGIDTPTVLHDGPDPLSVESAMDRLAPRGFHGATDLPEGAVWRVEREGAVDFLAKYVRPDKRDGAYLANVSGGDDIWLWR